MSDNNNNNQEQEFPEVAQVVKVFDQAHAKLFFNNDPEHSQPRNEPTVHSQKVAELKDELDRGLRSIMRDTDSELQALETELTTLAIPRGPISVLAGDDLTRASSLRRFVKEDAETLGLQALTDKIKASLADGDRASQALLLRYARQRLDKEHATGRLGVGSRVTVRDLESVVKELAIQFADPDTQKRAEMIKEQMSKMRRLKQAIDNVRPSKMLELEQRFGL